MVLQQSETVYGTTVIIIIYNNIIKTNNRIIEYDG